MRAICHFSLFADKAALFIAAATLLLAAARYDAALSDVDTAATTMVQRCFADARLMLRYVVVRLQPRARREAGIR